jgi:hypothetical protein
MWGDVCLLTDAAVSPVKPTTGGILMVAVSDVLSNILVPQVCVPSRMSMSWVMVILTAAVLAGQVTLYALLDSAGAVAWVSVSAAGAVAHAGIVRRLPCKGGG